MTARPTKAYLVAGAGFEPIRPRVMSPTSCRLLHPASSRWSIGFTINLSSKLVPKRGFEPTSMSLPSHSVSNNSTTSANQSGKSFISKISSEFD